MEEEPEAAAQAPKAPSTHTRTTPPVAPLGDRDRPSMRTRQKKLAGTPRRMQGEAAGEGAGDPEAESIDDEAAGRLG